MAPVRRANRRQGQHPRRPSLPPDGPPRQTLRRIIGRVDLWFTEQIGDYGGQVSWGASVFELRDGTIARERDYFAEPFEAPAWRAKWVDRR